MSIACEERRWEMKVIEMMNSIDWNQVAAGWLIVEQVLANSKKVEANSTFQLVCNIIDAVIGVFKKGETNEKTSDIGTPGI